MTNPATVPPTTIAFHIPKERIRFIAKRLPVLQSYDFRDGKFARRVGRTRRKFTALDREIFKELDDTQRSYTLRDNDGKPVPVFKEKDGEIVFRKDKNGQVTDEPVIIAGAIRLTDEEAYQKEYDELMAEIVVVECEPFTEDEIDSFKKVRGDVIDAMMDLTKDSEYARPSATAAPAATEGPAD